MPRRSVGPGPPGDEVQAAATQQGANTVIQLGGGSSVTLDSLSMDSLTAADFTLVQYTGTPGDLTPGNHDYQPSGASIALKDTSANQDNCKSVTVPLDFSANAS